MKVGTNYSIGGWAPPHRFVNIPHFITCDWWNPRFPSGNGDGAGDSYFMIDKKWHEIEEHFVQMKRGDKKWGVSTLAWGSS